MGIPEWTQDEERAMEDARAARRAGREADRVAEPVDAPSCSAALAARSIEEQVVPI